MELELELSQPPNWPCTNHGLLGPSWTFLSPACCLHTHLLEWCRLYRPRLWLQKLPLHPPVGGPTLLTLAWRPPRLRVVPIQIRGIPKAPLCRRGVRDEDHLAIFPAVGEQFWLITVCTIWTLKSLRSRIRSLLCLYATLSAHVWTWIFDL